MSSALLSSLQAFLFLLPNTMGSRPLLPPIATIVVSKISRTDCTESFNAHRFRLSTVISVPLCFTNFLSDLDVCFPVLVWFMLRVTWWVDVRTAAAGGGVNESLCPHLPGQQGSRAGLARPQQYWQWAWDRPGLHLQGDGLGGDDASYNTIN